jgi:hypothetical protein
MWAFLIATAIPPALFASAARQRCFAGTGGGFEERDGSWNKAPGPSRVSFHVRRSLVTNYANCCWTLFTSAKGGSGWREQDRRLEEKASIGRSTPSFWLKAPCVTYFRMAFLENNFTKRRNSLHNPTNSRTTRSRNTMGTSRIAVRTFGIVDAPRLHHEPPTIRPCPRWYSAFSVLHMESLCGWTISRSDNSQEPLPM